MYYNYNGVSFPGLGIGEFEINSTAFSIIENKLTVEWYAIFICVGLLLAYIVCDRLAKRFDIKGDDILDVLLLGLPAAFIGARVWYILGDLDSFDSFMDVISVWNGGLAIYGGIFGGCLAGYFVCKRKKVAFTNMLDLASVGFLIGQIIGRWGNFTNVEVFGAETNLPWRMGINVMEEGIAQYDWVYVHPLFLYEALWNLLGLAVIFAYMDSRKYKGELFLFYTAWYGIGRAWMEPLRAEQYNLEIFGVQVNTVLAILIAVVSIGALVYIHVKKPQRLVRVVKAEETENSYERQFDYAMESDADATNTASESLEKKEEDDGEDY